MSSRAALSSTGLGAVVGVPMMAFGAANVLQGSGNLLGMATGKNWQTPNLMQEGMKVVGKATGEKVANGLFYAADITLGIASGGGAAKLIKDVNLVKSVARAQGALSGLKTVGKIAVENTVAFGKNILNSGKQITEAVRTNAGYLKTAAQNVAAKGSKSVYLGSGFGSLQGALDKAGEVVKEFKAVKSASGSVSLNDLKKIKGPVKNNEVVNYQEFNTRSVKGDNLEGHELLQHALLKENGLATARLSTPASK